MKSRQPSFNKAHRLSLNNLDMEDLYILILLSDNFRMADIAKQFRLSQGAIFYRLKKIESVLDIQIFDKVSGLLVLSENARKLSQLAKQAIRTLERFF